LVWEQDGGSIFIFVTFFVILLRLQSLTFGIFESLLAASDKQLPLVLRLDQLLASTPASSSEEKLSISNVEMFHARRTAAWSVYTFGLASLTMTHQPIEEGGANGDFFGFRPLI
jgi:hypothetical protein